MVKKFFCPVNGWDCPYWKKDGSCAMVDDGDNPVEECDDAAFFYDDDENPFVWQDEASGKLFDTPEEAYAYELKHAPRYVNNSGVGPA